MKIILSFLLIFFAWIYAKGQNIDELIESNKKNLINLYQTRGSPPDWVVSGNVNQKDINRVLNEYNSNIGLLIYNYKKDTLQIYLIEKNGEINTRYYKIEEAVLINEIENANKWFSSNNLSRAPTIRGAKVISTSNNKSYQESYKNISNILLPFDKNLLKRFHHLIIVPTLNISVIPFSALKISEEEYLIDVMSYSIAPSLYEFMVNDQMKENRGLNGKVNYNFRNALFVANPKFPNDSIWDFPSLPGTEKEVNYITHKLDSSTYTKLVGDDAKIKNFKQNICDFDLLYFATHGITNESDPLDNSFLVLSEQKGESYLTAREIQNIRLNCSLKADLVILSACQTGLGKSHKAGLIGLSRGFQIAGANHVLMSLWNISDNETATLMGLFFDNLMKGGELMPHAALRKAILTYKSMFNSNPNYWAAFSIFGTPY
jgi:CHAT domain-containing protein